MPQTFLFEGMEGLIEPPTKRGMTWTCASCATDDWTQICTYNKSYCIDCRRRLLRKYYHEKKARERQAKRVLTDEDMPLFFHKKKRKTRYGNKKVLMKDPTPKQIAQRAAEVRAGWDEKTRRERWVGWDNFRFAPSED